MLKKVIKMYKDLPQELRLILAMAGLGTPFGIIWVVKTYLFPRTPMIYLIFGVAILAALLALLGWLLFTVLGWGRKKRSAKFANDLAKQEAAGPVSMDVRASIKSNNEKFFSAIHDMRKNLNVNVYDLPWYIVIGDSGCGKTKLVNEGGLTFSTGKPEGYQLGTLNYNWWFTEDAIFVDMAGRLCNPQDDADYREWSSFLDTIAKGRKGFPINGAIVCVSAEHLLQDAPEKHEQDANTALERLRELQTRLGVTFATYLVVTKCDKILGFMQFFDRAERDISYRNQIFGWSKPGSYNDLYDPDNFKSDFDALYSRLNELRIRRLNDDVDEYELGLAYSYPEEFRELRDPLSTYVRTLFPMIKQARVVKNLIFRGIYFTSATQQGSVILKHLAERLGNDAAQNFPPLESLYPRPRTHFIKDLFFRKVFKEYGLVFRNEQEAERNRKLARIFRMASVGVTVVVLALLIYGITSFNNLIGNARAMVIEEKNDKGETAPARVVSASRAETEALKTCIELAKHRQNLQDHPWAARILSLFWDSGQPVRDIQTVRTTLFQEGVLRKALKQVEHRLSTTDLGRAGDADPKQKDQVNRFVDSLTEYLYLVSYKDRTDERPDVTQERLVRLFGVIKDKDSLGEDIVLEVKWKLFVDELAQYITEAGGAGSSYLNPSMVLSDKSFKPEETVAAALESYRKFLAPVATLTENHPDEVVRQWMKIRKSCTDAMAAYGSILELSDRTIDAREALQTLKADFDVHQKAFVASLDQCVWKMKTDEMGRPTGKVELLSTAVQRIQKEWMDKYLLFYRTYTQRNPDGTLAPGAAATSGDSGDVEVERKVHSQEHLSKAIVNSIQGFIYRRTGESALEEGLEETLRRTLGALDLLDMERLARDAEDSQKRIEIHKYIKEVADVHAYVLQSNRHTGDPPEVVREIGVTADAVLVRSTLEDVGKMLAKMTDDQVGTGGLILLGDAVGRIGAAADEVSVAEAAPLPELSISEPYRQVWASARLAAFVQTQKVLIARGTLTQIVDATARSIAAAAEAGGWGLAELMQEFEKSQGSFYSITIPKGITSAKEPAGAKPTPSPASTGPRRFSDRGERRTTGSPSQRPTRAPASVADRLHTETIPICATRFFLVETFSLAGGLADLLREIPVEFYLAEQGVDPSKAVNEQLARAKRVYLDQYFSSWSNAYQKVEFKALDRILTTEDWGQICTVMKTFQTDIGRRLGNATAELLENVAWADYRWDSDAWYEDRLMLNDARVGAWRDTQFQREIVDMPGLDAESPWNSVAERLERGWSAFAKDVGNYPKLPDNFTDPGQEKARRIDWAVVDDDLATRLDDLKFVDVITKSSQHCRKAADREVHGRFLKIQQGHKFSGDNLPYLPGKQVETVDPKNFARFISQVLVAETLLQPLDQTLEGYKRREPFYKLCREWEEFIAPGDTDAYSKALAATITMDPEFASGQHFGVQWIDAADRSPWGSSAPVTGAANFYSKSELWLGLSAPERQDPIELQLTAEAGVIEAAWQWPAEGRHSYLATIKLSGKGSQIYKRDWPEVSIGETGKINELMFPAFLERLGKPDTNRKVWRVGVRWDLKALYNAANARDAAGDIERLSQLSAEDKIVGTKYEFTLDRKLPEPIRCLTPLSE